jgi:hypothetical protein
MVGSLALRALTTVIIPSHLEQRDGASLNIRGEEGHYCSDSLKIGMVG